MFCKSLFFCYCLAVEIRVQDFRWLVKEKFGNEKLSALARLLNQQSLELYSADDFEDDSVPEYLTEVGVKSAIDALVTDISASSSFYELGDFYRRTSDRIALMNSFTSWRLIKEYKEGGVFLDVSRGVHALLVPTQQF